jgi:ZIP family zinc transporter
MLELLAAATATALATGIGAIPVARLGRRAENYRPVMLGVASGVMAVAATAGLLLPALDEGSALEVFAGSVVGILFLLGARSVLGHRRHDAIRLTPPAQTSILVFAVLLVHSLPEGFAIGTAYASDTAGLGLFVVIAIGVQNIPEGTSVAIPLALTGASSARQFWAAVATSAPQPLGAAIAYLAVEQVTGLLPLSFAFAAGAMLALLAVEMLPTALSQDRRSAVVGGLAGGAGMLAFSLALSV